MVRTRPLSSITTPLPIRSVPRMGAVNASSGISARTCTTESSAASRSKRQSSGFGRISTGNAHCCSAMNRGYTRPMVKIESQGGIARVFLDRPEKSNALNSAFLQEISDSFEKLKGDAALRVVVLAGRGRAFCGGADVAELSALDASSGGAFV